ncbi:Hemolysin, contains CBS domains [Quadrisphaera granulorum]|uniref:CBS domain containing-hemolysin-like protein n=1 Tax=Quadrisphaera granulorum TaxID=317664 RepID=A0A316ARH5_9ACTN|nr:hemolysin family protein [Quadrisphaera granulorum]PWJ52687.1 CBS domain containing-hemolysin-like protein [Quadrisphaera granulorum]SZE97509.1 Hemolysin, contains CBS domains [Quadrisphaera granulorum]
MSDGLAIWLAVVLLALNAFFVGAEFAVISARRSSVELLAAGGSRAARTTLRAMEDVTSMLSCAQLGITLCSLGLGAVGEPAVAHQLEPVFEALGLPDALVHPVAFAIALALVVNAHVVLGEVVPKNLALAGPDRAALVLAPPLRALATVLRPVIAVSNWIANHVLRLFKVEPKDEVTSAFTREEVAGLVAEARSEGLLEEDVEELATAALGFADRTASAVLLPLDSLATLPGDATVAEVQDAAARTGYSRFPIEDGHGGLAGYVHIKDVLTLDPEARAAAVPARYVRDLTTVSEFDTLRPVLRRMQETGAHLARVEGSDGELLGVATLEDVLEELVGEVRASGAGAPHAPHGTR